MNLLVIFESLWHSKSVTEAAKASGLSQPAMSHSLKRLREEFEDPLFTPGSKKILVPTSKAEKLAPKILETLKHARAVFDSEPTFDPATANTVVSIGTTDYFDMLIMPWLTSFLSKNAPGIKIVTKVLKNKNPKKELESGECDITIAGFFEDLSFPLYKQSLFYEEFACAINKNHPTIHEKISLNQYCKLKHLLISYSGDLFGVVDRYLKKQNKKRDVVVSVAGFQTAVHIVAETELVLTAPRRLLQTYKDLLPIQIHKPPVQMKGFDIIQVWHERTHNDPVLSWVRKKLFEYCRNI